jgi:hypothetical protein
MYILHNNFKLHFDVVGGGSITLSNKPKMTFSNEYQTGACQFDVLSRAKVALPLSFT